MMTLASTQVGYSLALVATRRDDNDFALSVWPLLRLTTLVFWLWSTAETLNRFYALAHDWQTAGASLFRSVDMALDVYVMQFEILFSSFRYGLSLSFHSR